MNDKQKEILVITQEECAEVIQEISKIFRFGIDGLHKDGIIHRNKLEEEIGDLLCMVELMIQFNIIEQDQVNLNKDKKLIKLNKWSHFLKNLNASSNTMSPHSVTK